MPIAGVVILTDQTKTMNVLNELQDIDGITTYGVHKDNNIVAVFEADTAKSLEDMNDWLFNEVEGILGVYPAYVNFEEISEA